MGLRLTGSITALATPFDSAGAVDFKAWQRLLEQQLHAGSAALVVAGSTGEAAALDDDEFTQLLQMAVATVAGKIPVLAGTGASATAKTIAQTQKAARCGADAALVVTPPYVRPTQAGLIAHYQAVADNADIPVVLYNVPSRTGCDMQPETVAVLAAHPRIIGIKEANPEPARMQALLALRSAEFSILSGDDPTFVRALGCGADGVVSVASNLVPGCFARICQLFAQADADAQAQAQALDAQLQPLYAFLAVEPNPIPLKAMLAAQGIGQGVRLPLLPLSSAHLPALQAQLATVAALELQSCKLRAV